MQNSLPSGSRSTILEAHQPMVEALTMDDLSLAHELVDLAADIALGHVAPSVAFDVKPDGSPVTAADTEVDAAIVDVLRRARPRDEILSEEGGRLGSAGRRWIIDPIDGTVAFAAGGRGWGTYVALEEDGELVLGVINHPQDHRRYWGIRGERARCASTRVGHISGPERTPAVSVVSDLAEARFMALPDVASPDLDRLAAVATQIPTTMDFFVDLVEGRIDILLCNGGEVWDHAAEVAIVEAAGGRFRDPLGGRRLDLRGGTYTNAALEAPVLALLGRG